MNPDQPSREQIEARITALLLGELPASEAELLRFTISRDPELQKLHDQLKVTIGFVREAMHPTGAPVERETPLKLPQGRRQTLLAHFKTTRPQPPLIPFWRRRYEIPYTNRWVEVAVVVFIICGLAAMLLPVIGGKRERASVTASSEQPTLSYHATSQQNAAINNMRQITAAVNEWKLETGRASGSNATELNGPEATTTSGRETTTHAMRSGPVAVAEYRLETGQPHVSPNSPGESTITQLPKIALPNTESTQTESEEATGVYSQQVVGYVNVSVPTDAMTVVANQIIPAPQTDAEFGGRPGSHNREERLRELSGNAAPPPPSVAMTTPPPAPEVQPQTGQIFVSPSDSGHTYATNFGELAAGNPSAPVAEVSPSGSVLPTFAFGGGALRQEQPKVPPPPPASVPPQVIAETPIAESPTAMAPDSVETPQAIGAERKASEINGESALASRENANASAVNESASYFTNSVSQGVEDLMQVTTTASASKSENPSTAPLLTPRSRQQYGRRFGADNGAVGQFQAVPPQPSTTPHREEERIQSAPAGGTDNVAKGFDWYLGQQVAPQSSGVGGGAGGGGGGAGRANVNGNQVQLSWPANAVNGNLGNQAVPQSNGGRVIVAQGGSAGSLQGQNGSVVAANSTLGLSLPANTANWNYGGGTVSFGSSAGNGAFQNRLQNSVHGAPNSIQPFDFPNQSSTSYATNAIAMNDAMTTVPTLGPVVSRESQNANTVVQNDDSLHHVHNGPINSVSGVPALNGVPIVGTLFPSSVLRSPPPAVELKDNLRAGLAPLPQQQYGQKEPIVGGCEKFQIAEAPEADKKVDEPRTPPQSSAPTPQPEILTSDNAFSTFSMNVSDVSFKLAMASLQKGQMPNPASIRSEEFINAFDYHDPEPLQGEPLAFRSERAGDPFAHERDLLRFSIKAAAVGRQSGRALNLVLLLDTSGSMERADRVAIIREALRVLSSQLQPQDVISVVTFARTARLWADGIPGNAAGATLDKVGSITPEGGTNLEEAMRLAYETALRHFIAGGMNRVVLLTDGAANLGNVDPQALTQKVDSERRQGIALDCFGIGWDDYNDDLLEQLSSNGDGRYAFINSPDEAATEFAAKLAGALEVAAEDVKVQVEFNPNRVTAWRQIGYAKHQLTKQQFRDNTVAAGAIASREAGNALYVVETRPDGEGPIATVRVRYRVPGTQDVHEHSWLVDYDGAAPELAQSSAAMRLAVTAAEISEWMAESPFAQDVTPDELLNYLSGVPQIYGTDERPKQLETMIREAKSVSGK